jgi:hypothetical protein
MIMRILTHGAIYEFHGATGAFQFLHQHHLVNIVPRQPIRAGDHHPMQYATPHSIPELV